MLYSEQSWFWEPLRNPPQVRFLYGSGAMVYDVTESGGTVQAMRFRIDIAQGEGAERNAAAFHVLLPAERELLVLAEVGRTDRGALQLLQTAVAAAAGALVCPENNESQARQLDAAMQAANRAVYTRKLQNPATDDLLVSLALVVVSPGNIHAAAVGTCSVFLRTIQGTIALCTPENAASRLGEQGLSAKPRTDEKGTDPVNGLGLPVEVFKLKQNKTIEEPAQYEIAMAGSGVMSRLSPAELSSAINSKDPESNAAERLHQAFTSKLGTGSGALSARRLTVSQPVWQTLPEPRNWQIPKAAWTVAGLVLAGILAFVVGKAIFGALGDSEDKPTRTVVRVDPTEVLGKKAEYLEPELDVVGQAELEDVASEGEPPRPPEDTPAIAAPTMVMPTPDAGPATQDDAGAAEYVSDDVLVQDAAKTQEGPGQTGKPAGNQNAKQVKGAKPPQDGSKKKDKPDAAGTGGPVQVIDMSGEGDPDVKSEEDLRPSIKDKGPLDVTTPADGKGPAAADATGEKSAVDVVTPLPDPPEPDQSAPRVSPPGGHRPDGTPGEDPAAKDKPSDEGEPDR